MLLSITRNYTQPKFTRWRLVSICAILLVLFPMCAPRPRQALTLALDQWIGWRGILYANGGEKTADDSILGSQGLQLQIIIIDDNTTKLEAYLGNQLDAFGSTVNRFAFEAPRLSRARNPARLGLVSNSSCGGDGLIVTNEIGDVLDLAGRKVAVPRFSEGHAFIELLLNLAPFSKKELADIRTGFVFTNSAAEAAELFFSQRVDAALTWQPFLSKAIAANNSQVLIDTSSIDTFIIDGVVFSQDALAQRGPRLRQLAAGVISANRKLKKTDPPKLPGLIRSVFPFTSSLSDSGIAEMYSDACLSDLEENRYLLASGGLVSSLISLSTDIWQLIGVLDRDWTPNTESLVTDELVEQIRYELNHKVIIEKRSPPRHARRFIPLSCSHMPGLGGRNPLKILQLISSEAAVYRTGIAEHNPNPQEIVLFRPGSEIPISSTVEPRSLARFLSRCSTSSEGDGGEIIGVTVTASEPI